MATTPERSIPRQSSIHKLAPPTTLNSSEKTRIGVIALACNDSLKEIGLVSRLEKTGNVWVKFAFCQKIQETCLILAHTLTIGWRRCYTKPAFRATCPSTPWRDKLHETLPNVTYCAKAKNVARQVAETVAESTIEIYFPQRFTQRCNEFLNHWSVV